MVVAVEIERSANDEAGHDEGEWNVAVLRVVVGVSGSSGFPEVVVLFGSGGEFLLKWHAVGGILKNLQSIQATSQGGMAVQPLMMDGTQLAVVAVDFGNDEKLVSLTHAGL